MVVQISEATVGSIDQPISVSTIESITIDEVDSTPVQGEMTVNFGSMNWSINFDAGDPRMFSLTATDNGSVSSYLVSKDPSYRFIFVDSSGSVN